MINIIHLVDRHLVSSINKEIIWDDHLLPEVLPLLEEQYKKHDLIMGKNTWNSLGAKKIGLTKNYVISRSNMFIPRGVKKYPSIVELQNENTNKEYNVIGGAKLISSVPICFLKSIYIIQLNVDSVARYSGKIEEYTSLLDNIYNLTKVIHDKNDYTIRLWKPYVDI